MCRMWPKEALFYEVAFVLGLGLQDIPNSFMKLGSVPNNKNKGKFNL